MKNYDLISVGSGSAMAIVEAFIQENPKAKIAVIEKDTPGGICLTRGCIPSKLLLYPAEVVRTIQKAKDFGIDSEIKNVDFKAVMERMRNIIQIDVNNIREGLVQSKFVDYYPEAAQFTAPYTLKVGEETITAKMIILGAGSKPLIPPIKGLEKTAYLTSDTVLNINDLPKTVVIVGAGYIAAEYGHFLSAMGAQVTIIGDMPQFIPSEEPEISAVAQKKLGEHVTIYTNYRVQETSLISDGKKRVIAINLENKKKLEVTADEILIATGRKSLSDVLHPEKGGIKTDDHGWITVNEYLETSQPNVWALGDANGQYPFKHVANHEASVVYYNALLKQKTKVDYHAVPHAVFTDPEIASVGLGEKAAIEQYGMTNVLIGFYRYEDTAKGEAMNAKDYFVKVIVEQGTMKVLGAHIVGPQASVLIHEIIPVMYTKTQSAKPIVNSMHIHPALSEVVERAFRSLMPPEHYHHILEHYAQNA
ncbi:MAG: dihydrolipoyl dehydrogenase [Candidatus Bathyarchaeota archaeon]|nr:dihydrolipoyl dehydrogenase [Candidatus Bathyarchaeum tardum]WGM90019.1 MAG: dihydrolipoyl dehydrogenase [Candidatus Bathyarchaeum tardum]WNZ29839.1 MAG: dihydrolipoyl dehydrogenase [Candidatus Bathyarchaeota archaeon]